MQYDVFISYASEDKEGFVRQLANALTDQQLRVWYDEFSLSVGDSIRRSIEIGLSQSRFGIVVLSQSFFAKRWTTWELEALLGRHLHEGGGVVLPLWHGVEHDEVAAYSSSLAEIKAIQTTMGVDKVVTRLMRVIQPQQIVLRLPQNGLFVPVGVVENTFDNRSIRTLSKYPFKGLIDTGASRTVIDKSVVKELQLSARTIRDALIVNGKGQTGVRTPTTFRAYGIKIGIESLGPLFEFYPDPYVIAMHLGLGNEIKVLIGMDVLKHCEIKFDGPRGLFSMKRSVVRVNSRTDYSRESDLD